VRRTGNREGHFFFYFIRGGIAAAVSWPRRAREGNGPQVRGVRRCGKGWAPVLGWMLGPCGSIIVTLFDLGRVCASAH
jgi:hypothetical protein